MLYFHPHTHQNKKGMPLNPRTIFLVVLWVIFGFSSLFSETNSSYSDFFSLAGKTADPVATEQSVIPQVANSNLTLAVEVFSFYSKFFVSAVSSFPKSNGAIQVYDVSGRLMQTLPLTLDKSAQVNWNLKDQQGRRVASGSYVGRLRIGGFEVSHKFIVL